MHIILQCKSLASLQLSNWFTVNRIKLGYLPVHANTYPGGEAAVAGNRLPPKKAWLPLLVIRAPVCKEEQEVKMPKILCLSTTDRVTFLQGKNNANQHTLTLQSPERIPTSEPYMLTKQATRYPHLWFARAHHASVSICKSHPTAVVCCCVT